MPVFTCTKINLCQLTLFYSSCYTIAIISQKIDGLERITSYGFWAFKVAYINNVYKRKPFIFVMNI